MTFAYNSNHRWRKLAKENFANSVKSRKSRTLNLAKFSRYSVREKDGMKKKATQWAAPDQRINCKGIYLPSDKIDLMIECLRYAKWD